MKSSVMYVVAWIYAIVGIISSFISGARFKELFRTSGADVTIAGIIGTVFVAIILFAIAKILENTEYTAAKVAAMEREMKKVNAPEPPKGASNSKMSLSDISSKSSGGEWRCPKCGKTNPISSRVCKDCGYQK